MAANPISRLTLYNRESCCPHRFCNIIVELRLVPSNVTSLDSSTSHLSLHVVGHKCTVNVYILLVPFTLGSGPGAQVFQSWVLNNRSNANWTSTLVSYTFNFTPPIFANFIRVYKDSFEAVLSPLLLFLRHRSQMTIRTPRMATTLYSQLVK